MLHKINFYTSETSTIDWLPDYRAVLFTQSGRNEGLLLQESLNAGLDCLNQKKTKKWISDNRNLISFRGTEDSDWLESDWVPRAVKAGWKYWALVQPEKIYMNLVYDRISELFQKFGVEVMIFSNLEDAFVWIQSIKD
ncbi:MAG: hypothetical protein KDK36_22220 [Leptospiraceae bacterium]|nr:hypothetical protein [Leptospiraceae bacterium]